MTELWIPQPDKNPDVRNIFDLMLTFQEQIDAAESHTSRYECARLAVDALAKATQRMSEVGREVTVLSELALIDSTDEADTVLLANNIGLRGTISDIQCVQLEQHIPMSLALGMDVLSVFREDSPDDGDFLLATAKAPIALVKYIETVDA